MSTSAKLTVRATHELWQRALTHAFTAGIEAGRGSKPVPMVVGTPKNMMASLLGGDDGGFDPNEPTYFVEGGVVGFAWVNVKGDRRFQNWLQGKVKSAFPAGDVFRKHAGYVHEARPDSYYKGTSLWVSGFGQSMQRKEAFAHALSKGLNAVEGVTAYPMSRMD